MIRMWKGPEMEGHKVGVLTLYVSADRIIDTKKIILMLEQHPSIRRLYLGAGRYSFQGVSSWSTLYDYLFAKGFEIVIEVGSQQLDEMIKKYDSLITTFIITRYEMPYTYNKLQFKTENNEVVNMYNVTSQTSLETLKDGNLFMSDTLLLEEK